MRLLLVLLLTLGTALAESQLERECAYLAAWAYAGALAREDGFSERVALRFLSEVDETTKNVIRTVYAWPKQSPTAVRAAYYRQCLAGGV